MGKCIGFAGKGGTGKTTLAGLLVRYLVEKGKVPVLAVDADSNSNLNEVLGLKVETTVSDAREEMKEKAASLGMTKDMFIEMKINEALVEADGFDLIAMGRPEGPGCYCAANALLTEFLSRLLKNYPYIVIDNEAGMEHISRLRAKDMDILITVSDASLRGIETAFRIANLADELNFSIKEKYLVINMIKEEKEEEILKDEAKKFNLKLIGSIPEDPMIHEFELYRKPLTQLTKDSLALRRAYAIFDRIIS